MVQERRSEMLSLAPLLWNLRTYAFPETCSPSWIQDYETLWSWSDLEETVCILKRL